VTSGGSYAVGLQYAIKKYWQNVKFALPISLLVRQLPYSVGLLAHTFLQGRIEEFAKGGAVAPVPFLFPSHTFPLSSPPPLEVGRIKPARGSGPLGSAVSSPSGVWGAAPAENKCDAL